MSSDSYRYGFQNQEVDPEIKGEGNSVNYKYRMHDPRVGRFFAVDPLAKDYPFYSHYAFSGNRVIDCIELEGLEPKKMVHYYNMVKQSNGTYKPVFSHSTANLVIKTTNARFTNSISGTKWGLIEGNHGNQYQTTNVYTYWDSNGKINSQSVHSRDMDSQLSEQWEKDIDAWSKNEQYPEKPKPKIGDPQDLELRIQAGSSSVGVGAIGAEADLFGWQYYSICSGEGWEEKGSIKMHEFALLDFGAGLSFKPGIGVDLLSIGGGTLSIQGDYLKKHPTISLVDLLNNRNIITTSGGCGYKYTTFDIFSDEMELIARGSVHSFSLCTPSGGTRQGTAKFE